MAEFPSAAGASDEARRLLMAGLTSLESSAGFEGLGYETDKNSQAKDKVVDSLFQDSTFRLGIIPCQSLDSDDPA